PPPPPPPAAKTGVSEAAVLSASRTDVNVPSLIASLIIRASCLRMRRSPRSARVNSALIETFPERFALKWVANNAGASDDGYDSYTVSFEDHSSLDLER